MIFLPKLYCCCLCLILSALIRAEESSNASDDNRKSTMDFNCSATATYAFLRSEGKSVNLRSVSEYFPKTYREPGTQVPIPELLRVIRLHGIDAYAIKVGASADFVPSPAIVLIGDSKLKEGHFAVITSASPRDVEIVDPMMLGGVRRISRDDLKRIWAGYAIVSKSADFP